MIDFKTLIELNGRNNKIVQITNLLDNGLDIFSNAISETENTIRKRIEESTQKSSELSNKVSNYSEDNNHVPTEDDYKLMEVILHSQSDIYTSTAYLTALAEMKVIYLFKCLEISMKSLIQMAYPKINTKEFFQWREMVLFFKSIDIKISDIIGYQEVVTRN